MVEQPTTDWNRIRRVIAEGVRCAYYNETDDGRHWVLAGLYVATGREVPREGIENKPLTGFLTDYGGPTQILLDEYGLSGPSALTLARTGDQACGLADLDPFTEATTDWPEAEIVQALLAKVDELEAEETSNHDP